MAVRATRSRRTATGASSAAIIALAVSVLCAWSAPPLPLAAAMAPAGGAPLVQIAGAAGDPSALGHLVGGTTGSPEVALGIQVAPEAICASSTGGCAAGVGEARVTITGNVVGAAGAAWPAVQVAFVLETTPYDGVYESGDGDGWDACLGVAGAADPCESSNGVPFFAVNAQAIANAISASNPHTQVSFALVDYFATPGDWDDGDGAEYHVDTPSFVPASGFGQAVQDSLVTSVLQAHSLDYGDSDLADNFLHSSSITALYGTLVGSGLDWSPDTHHVIVWMGSTAPRDPDYPENYCVSASFWASQSGQSCLGRTCEPSFPFQGGSSPDCEGWVKSRDGAANDSIAGLALSATECTASVGGSCTVDTIDYWNTPTDPFSTGWPNRNTSVAIGGGPGGPQVIQDAANILAAGCAMAAATGGSWDGPAYWSCPSGATGTLQYVGPGPGDPPDAANPTLYQALGSIGFGPVIDRPVLSPAGVPLFTFVPYGNIALSSDPGSSAACLRGGATFTACQTAPTVLHAGGVTYLGWNWSTNPSSDAMLVGDGWTASFNIIATGPPYRAVPVDACTVAACVAAGSGAIGGLFSWATFLPSSGGPRVAESFPLGTVDVETSGPASIGVPAAPPATPPPPTPAGAPGPLPFSLQSGGTPLLGFGQVSFQAIAAGFLAAGFLRLTIKNKPIALRVAANYNRVLSKYGEAAIPRRAERSRFE